MVLTSLFILGFVSLGFQILLLREVLSIFADNELIIGIFLAFWTVTVALGAYIAGVVADRLKNVGKLSEILISLVGFVMPIEIFFVRFLRPFWQKVPTEMPDLLPTIVFLFLSVIIVCLLFGAWFVLMVKIFSEYKISECGGQTCLSHTGKLYAVECLGAVFGGLLTSIFFIKYLDALQISLLFSLIIFGVLLFHHLPFHHSSFIIHHLPFIPLILSVVFLYKSTQIKNLSVKYQWRPFDVVESKDSVYGKITVLKNEDGYDFYENSNRVYSTIPSAESEEITHIPILSSRVSHGCKNVLLLGGGLRNVTEVLKYKVETVAYVEQNPVFIELLKKYADTETKNLLKNSKVKIIQTDGRFYIRNVKKISTQSHECTIPPLHYDCIVLDVPQPLTGLTNRYFTDEFFKDIKNILYNEGILIFSLPASENYMSNEMKLMFASVYKTANNIFSHCYIVPASRNYFICSSFVVDINPKLLIEKIRNQKIDTKYLAPGYLNYILRADRVEKITSLATEKRQFVLANRDFYPICYFYGLNYWLSVFGKTVPQKLYTSSATTTLFAIFGLISIFLINFFIRKKKMADEMVIVVVSCASVIFELIIIFAFQSVYGYIYYKIGILLSLCLLGITVGSYISSIFLAQKDKMRFTKTILFLMFLFSLVLSILFHNRLPCTFSISIYFNFISEFIFYILIFVAGSFIGFIFPLVVQGFIFTKTIGKFYCLDLLGSMLGFVSVSLIFIPLFGLTNTSLFVANFVFFLLLSLVLVK